LLITLVKNSNIFELKSKFFIRRFFGYLIFFFSPLIANKIPETNKFSNLVFSSIYIFFILVQCFLLGKEVDYRLKIYFKINSSIDKITYRLLMGIFSLLIISNILILLPGNIYIFCFWIFWGTLSLFYSWPTRGKIIKENFTTYLSEYKFLDSFEKTLLYLIFIIFLISIPSIPSLSSPEAIKLILDPSENISNYFWNFLNFIFLPFESKSLLFKYNYFLFFYYMGFGVFLVTFYSMLRFFVSRRLSILGIFSLLSSWSICKIMAQNFGETIASTYGIIILWSLLWGSKSDSYRGGLFLGFVGLYISIINPINFLLIPFIFSIFIFYSLNNKNFWYKRKLSKYFSIGFILSLISFILNIKNIEIINNFDKIYTQVFEFLNIKAFFYLSILGFSFSIILLYKKKIFSRFNDQFFDKKYIEIFLCILTLFIFSFLNLNIFHNFNLIWPISLLSIVPLEIIFNQLNRSRSTRNIILGIYILICLLDSHLEERVRIFSYFFS
jgi:hypothetical protein